MDAANSVAIANGATRKGPGGLVVGRRPGPRPGPGRGPPARAPRDIAIFPRTPSSTIAPRRRPAPDAPARPPGVGGRGIGFASYDTTACLAPPDRGTLRPLRDNER